MPSGSLGGIAPCPATTLGYARSSGAVRAGSGIDRMETCLLGYQCRGCDCGTVNTDMTRDPVCPARGVPQEAVYDLAAARGRVDRDGISHAPRGMWRWSALLPLRDAGNRVSLVEGDTPLVHALRLGDALGLRHLFLKDESRNPTGSFKDRGAAVTVSKCKEVGVSSLILASSGNAAVAFSAYAARAGLTFFGFVRDDSADVGLLQAMVPGARIHVVEGGMADGTRLAGEVASKYGFFHCTQPYNLYRFEGKKTLAFEIAEQLGWRAPDRILIPTSGGTNAVAIHKGFEELNTLGWVEGMPAIDVVEPAGGAPIVTAWREKRPVEPWPRRGTRVLGLGHPFPRTGDRIVEIMNETGGRGWLAGDEAMFEAGRLIARTEGLFVQPASAAPVAALMGLGHDAARKFRDQTIVVIATGSGKNQVREPLAAMPPPPRIAHTLAAFESVNPGLG